MSLAIFGLNSRPAIPSSWERSFASSRSRIKTLSWTRVYCRPAGVSSSPVLPQVHELQQAGEIRELFHGVDDLCLVSPYDMGWIAMVPDASGSRPHFPSSIRWILDNQSPDGSWGKPESEVMKLLQSTLACLVALQKWSINDSSVRKGLMFVKKNLPLLDEHLAPESSVIVAKLLAEAQESGLMMNYEESRIQALFTRRQHFLNSVPSRMLEEYPFSFVHILEAFQGIIWSNLLKHQCSDGFLFSLTLTACAYVKTGDKMCLHCLSNAVNGPSSPSDWSLLVSNARLIVLLEHFGIQRYFEKEIHETLSHAFGFCRGVESTASLSTEDAALLFRFLRSIGFEVSPEVFRNPLRKAETIPAITGFELQLASQYLFRGEHDTNGARSELMKHNECCNDEMRLLMMFPWYSRMQRIEHIDYIKNHGKSKPASLVEFSRLDFNRCQLIYQKDLEQVVRWCKECEFSRLAYARQKDVLCYFAPAATIFEPEFSSARIVWAKMGVLTTMTDDLYDHHHSLDELQQFYSAVQHWDPSLLEGLSEETKLIFHGLYNTVNRITDEAYGVQKRDIGHHLQAQWSRLVYSELQEAEWRLTAHCPGMKEYMNNGVTSFALEPIMMSTIFFMGAELEDRVINHPDCQNLYRRVSLVGRLLNDIQGFKRESSSGEFSWITIYMREHPGASIEDTVSEMRKLIDQTLQELVEDLLRPREVPKACKRVFDSMLRVLLTFYRDGDGYTSEELSHHVKNVLKFQL